MDSTLAHIEQLLAQKNAEFANIQADVNKARELLDSCDERLKKFRGTPQQQKPLKDYVKQILSAANEPLTVKEIAELVLEHGYKTTSNAANFRNIVLQALAADAEFKRKTRLNTKPARFAYEGV